MSETFMHDPRDLKVKDFVITDEFEMIKAHDGIKAAITKLIGMNRGVLLVKEDSGEIKGVVTERKILKKILESNNPMTLRVGDIMDVKILKINYDDHLPDALERIDSEKPSAVIVVNKKGEFKGYFSPMDYLQAEAMLKDAKKRRHRTERIETRAEKKEEAEANDEGAEEN